MKIAFAVLSFAVLLFQVDSCDKPKPAPKPSKITYPIRRFEHSAGTDSGLAMDTLTGQLCKTWEWVYTSPNAPSHDMQTLPTCLSLFNDYPSEKEEPSSIPQSAK